MNKLNRTLISLWLVISCSIGSPQPCMAGAIVTLKGETQLQGMTVRLSDLFNGVPADIDRDIAQAPPPGRNAVYDAGLLKKLADKYRLDWTPVTLSDHTTITSDCTRITAERIRDAVAAKVKDQLEDPHGREVDVSFDSHETEIDLPAGGGGDFTLENAQYDATAKRFRADLIASTSSGPYTAPVSAHITIKRDVPVLIHHLDAGSIIAANDLDVTPIPEDRVNGGVVTEMSQLVGHELRRDTEEGEALHVHDIIPPRLVKRNSLIVMKIETPFMTVSAQGKAMQDGTQGDTVRVLNVTSNRTIEGTVTGPDTVTIHAGQKFAEAAPASVGN